MQHAARSMHDTIRCRALASLSRRGTVCKARRMHAVPPRDQRHACGFRPLPLLRSLTPLQVLDSLVQVAVQLNQAQAQVEVRKLLKKAQKRCAPSSPLWCLATNGRVCAQLPSLAQQDISINVRAGPVPFGACTHACPITFRPPEYEALCGGR